MKFLIVGTGRSGSSLLGAILSEAGGQFSIEHQTTWNKTKGAMEDPYLIKAYSYFNKARKIEDSIIPSRFLKRNFLNKCDKYLMRASKNANFMKSSTLLSLVHRFKNFCEEVKIIVVYRKFESYARSRYMKDGWSYNKLKEEYIDSYRTAILQIHSYGGVLISYEELTDDNENLWASNLSQLTGLDFDAIMMARNKLVDKPTYINNSTPLNEDADKLYQTMRRLSEK